ncbi:hypothetical protein LTR05_001586 [Lithohypha guttulata]|uniref:Uncharacterized protein n=1 Tax=Lithohypha guttulata TaxID=1690604 RepID=A0AAN7T6T6_9EURO|nr:hypothetical protein LTR05_001586 [Lithohypha guttulata]
MAANEPTPIASDSESAALTQDTIGNTENGNGNNTNNPGTREPQNSGEAIVAWFDKLFQDVMTISSFGAGFTFIVIFHPFDEFEQDVKRNLSAQTVNKLLSVSWFCFVLALTLSAIMKSAFEFNKDNLAKSLNDPPRSRVAHGLVAIASFTVQALVLIGFLMSSQAITAFSSTIGMAAFWTTAILTGVLACVYLYQCVTFASGQ